jgi:anti-sigma B factor antagonist
MDVELSTTDNGILTCTPHGEIDAFNVGELRTHFAELSTGVPVIIDLSAVPFMDSSGLGALIGATRRVREAGGEVAVVCTQSAVLRLFHTTRFDRMVSVLSSTSAAEQALKESPS